MLQSATNAQELATISSNGQKMLQAIEDSPKPVVAAIMGTALGGGLEVDVISKFIFNCVITGWSWDEESRMLCWLVLVCAVGGAGVSLSYCHEDQEHESGPPGSYAGIVAWSWRHSETPTHCKSNAQ